MNVSAPSFAAFIASQMTATTAESRDGASPNRDVNGDEVRADAFAAFARQSAPPGPGTGLVVNKLV